MKRVKVQLKDLRANPYKKHIQGGRIDPVIVAQIKESATKTSFWEQWVVRETDKGFELAFGHHRLQAAKDLFGGSYEVSVQVEPYTDEQMLIALADENSGDEESVEAQVDVVRIARTYLIENPSSCRHVLHSETDDPKRKSGDARHEHGSIRCLIAFLGETNWNERKLQNLISIADRFDADLLNDVASSKTHPERRGVMGVQTAGELSKLDKPAQKEVVKALREAREELTEFKDRELGKREEKNLPRAAIKDMGTHIPTAVVKAAVRKAENLPPAKQAAAVVKHIQQEVRNRKDFAVTASVPDAEKVVSKVIAQCFNFPHDETVQELIANREHLSSISKSSLLSAFGKLKVRITKYEEELVKPPLKKLGK